jgi:2-polyprenyl-6-methoxyphenol hydroxylase-like FAD-dependent oxidoreductase
MALEDAAVLAEVLLAHDELTQDVFDEFVQRRMPRATAVVDGSVQLATWLLEGKRDADVPGLMGRVMGLISQPA